MSSSLILQNIGSLMTPKMEPVVDMGLALNSLKNVRVLADKIFLIQFDSDTRLSMDQAIQILVPPPTQVVMHWST